MPTTISPEERARRIEFGRFIAKTPSAFLARHVHRAITDLLEMIEGDTETAAPEGR